ncbi:lysosomal acid glucosylceramidase-like [Planococcus citri]|uniref:lysosomal acid glucosylceramidase-like n=1 Tax=Planococcus citri TaxID=170843 RepID=UPI0031F9FF7E
MDKKDESMSTFMLTELDFKYKIPIILEAMKITHNQLKLIGSAWWAPLWMKTVSSMNRGTLKREYWSQWAEYHVKFLDQYSRNDIKFWAISTGNRPTNSHYFTYQPNINTMEWTPYEQSEWVSSYLNPMLKNSSHSRVLLLGFDDNRGFVTFYLKYFFEDYQLNSFDDSTYEYLHKSRVKDAISGIAFHGYMDHERNLPYLQQTKDMFHDKFLIYTETGCVGATKLGAWTCGETFAIKIIQALNNWVTGWMDWNIALDPKGGPKLANNLFHSPIIIDTKRDEFYKDPAFYVMAHFSIFLLPNSYRIELKAPRGIEGIYAVAGYRPDDGKVIVFYNQYEAERQLIFLIDENYKVSLTVPGQSINSVLFW